MRSSSILAYWFSSSSDGGDSGSGELYPSATPDPSRPIGVSPQDRALAARLKLGDVKAFDEIVLQYYPALCAFTARITRSSAVAEELVQDVLASLWINRESLVLRESVRAYLFAAVRNRALKVLRHEQTVTRLHGEAGEFEVYSTVASATERLPDKALEQRELALAIDAAASVFPSPRRDIFYLRWQGGLTYPEIASLLGLSVKTVEMHLSKAFRSLREQLEGFR